MFLITPLTGIMLSLILWCIIEFNEKTIRYWIRGVSFLILISFGVYPVLLIGWSSNRKYALIGAVRAVAQTISYEIRLALILLAFLTLAMSMKIRGVIRLNKDILLLRVVPVIGCCWFISCLAETNRTPFDFAEGESELVSGFNVEYGAIGFTLIFISEYSIIILFRLISSILLVASRASSPLTIAGMVAVAAVWVWVRATYPRYRYDKLINLAWKRFLPAALVYLIWVRGALCY